MKLLRPGGELARRPLHFIWIADCSTSMKSSGKMNSLNNAISEALPHMSAVAAENPNADVLIRAISFSSGARWHVSEPVPIDNFVWKHLEAGGVTDMGKAFSLLEEVLNMPPMENRALPPVLVLVTDGQPTDDYKTALNSLMRKPWARKAVRLGIGIGRSANKRVLKEFIGNDDIPVLCAENSQKLVEYIKWASTVVLQAASAPSSQGTDFLEISGNVVIPQISTNFWDDDDISVEDVW